MLSGAVRSAGITMTTVMFPSPHPALFTIPQMQSQGYPQVDQLFEVILSEFEQNHVRIPRFPCSTNHPVKSCKINRQVCLISQAR